MSACGRAGCCSRCLVLMRTAAVQLLRSKDLSLSSIRFFVIDECDKVLDKTGGHRDHPQMAQLAMPCRQHAQPLLACRSYVWPAADPACCADMRSDVQNIFKSTPHSKQVMMFSATLSKEIRPVCKKFMNEVRSRRQLASSPSLASQSDSPASAPGAAAPWAVSGLSVALALLPGLAPLPGLCAAHWAASSAAPS